MKNKDLSRSLPTLQALLSGALLILSLSLVGSCAYAKEDAPSDPRMEEYTDLCLLKYFTEVGPDRNQTIEDCTRNLLIYALLEESN